jgi:putative nucleotidyltransferase with HDIG domain
VRGKKMRVKVKPVPKQTRETGSMLDLSRVLQPIFLIAILILFLISLNMILNEWDEAALSLVMELGVTLLLFLIFKLGYPRIAGFGLLISISALITYNFLIEGGIHDNGMVIFPVLITISGLVLGRKIVPYMTMVSLFEASLLYWLAATGVTKPYGGVIQVDIQDYLTVMTLLLISGILIGITMTTIENNLGQLVQAEHQLRESYNLTLDGWGRALELFDKETEGHSIRVTELTLEIARTLKIPENDMEHIRRGALLHDIGKMGISDQILNKAGSLTKEERKAVEEHPWFAYQLLKDIPYLEKALEIPYSHHEYWDGTGYPQGLRGENIPLSARIFAIADNWDALTSNRPYRKAWPKEDVIRYIQDQAGEAFDPDLVAVFVEKILPKL